MPTQEQNGDSFQKKKATGRRKGDTAAFSSKSQSETLMRVPPHNLDAEEGVLASILLDETGNEVINACIAAKIREEYFFGTEHRIVYGACLALFSDGRAIDIIVLGEWLDKRGFLDKIGGIERLNDIAGRIETTTNYRQWMEIIREKYFMREIIRACSETIDRAFSNDGEIDSFIGGVEEKILGIGQDRVGDSVKKASEQIDGAIANIQNLISSKGELMGVPTGFKDLDVKMRGLHENEMIVIAGRPGTGKTSIALNIVESAIFGKIQYPTLVFSLEMLAEQLYSRMIASRARVDLHKLSMGLIGQDRMRDIYTTANEIKNAPMWIDDTSGMTILEMRAKARRLNQKLDGKLGLVVVDYLQLLQGSDSQMSREQVVAEISRGMKAMAKELRVPVIVLAQLNRESEKDQGRPPRASDLRESGSIEQDADAILLLSRQRKSATDEDSNANQNWPIRVELAKQRNGPTGVLTLLFNRNYTRYENYISTNDVQI